MCVFVRMYYTCNTGASYLLSGPSLYSAGRYASYAGKNLETKSRTYNALISERQNEGCIRRTDSWTVLFVTDSTIVRLHRLYLIPDHQSFPFRYASSLLAQLAISTRTHMTRCPNETPTTHPSQDVDLSMLSNIHWFAVVKDVQYVCMLKCRIVDIMMSTHERDI